MYKLAKEKALETLKGNWGEAMVISIIYGVIMSALSSIGVGVIIFSVTAGVCLSFALIQASMDKKFKVDNLFIKENFSNLSNQIGASALSFLYIFLWSLLFLIPGIVKSYSYRLVKFIALQEPNLSPSEVLKKSEELMKGKRMDLFIFDLSFIGWHILCGLTFGIGYLWLTPYIYQAEIEYVHANIMPLRFNEINTEQNEYSYTAE